MISAIISQKTLPFVSIRNRVGALPISRSIAAVAGMVVMSSSNSFAKEMAIRKRISSMNYRRRHLMENRRPSSTVVVPPPTPTLCHRLPPRWIGSGDHLRSIPQSPVSIASTPLLMVTSKPDVCPSAPLKRFRGNEIIAQYTREPYEAALDRERAASVAAALEHAFWATKTENAEGDEIKMGDYLIDMTGAKLAKLPLFE